MTIGEFSARSGLSARRLRSSADVALLVPVAVDTGTGYRYYSAEQLRDAKLIDALRAAGIPLTDIAAFLRDSTPERLDTWTRQVDLEAVHRQRAIDLARSLLPLESASCGPDGHRDPGEETTVQLRSASRTDTGLVREANEDAVVATDRLAAVADGMGGAPGGTVASAVAASLAQAAFTGRSIDELAAAARAANRAIWDRAGGDPGLAGMGTTISAAGVMADGMIGVVNVGDSRVCAFRNGVLTRLTEDHSITAELVRRGELPEDEAREHPSHGILTRALGVGPDVEIDLAVHPAVAGDRLLVATDGLFNETVDDEIAELLATNDELEAATDALIELTLSRGARDNVSVVIAEVVESVR
jgi:PPM family protein phosphatase